MVQHWAILRICLLLSKSNVVYTHEPSCLLSNKLTAAVSLLQTVCIRMAQLLDGAGKLGWVLLKSVTRFVFMFLNNCVAIPSYCLYLLLLQPLRIWDSSTFWHIEGIMFKWLLAMVSSWGWIAGYTGKTQCCCCSPCCLACRDIFACLPPWFSSLMCNRAQDCCTTSEVAPQSQFVLPVFTFESQRSPSVSLKNTPDSV